MLRGWFRLSNAAVESIWVRNVIRDALLMFNEPLRSLGVYSGDHRHCEF